MKFELTEMWTEVLAIFFLLLGFLIAVLLMSPWLTYVIVVLTGFLAGRVLYIKRYAEPIFPFVLIIVGFLFGFILGSIWASRFLAVILFLLGLGVSYYLHLKKYLVILESNKDIFIK